MNSPNLPNLNGDIFLCHPDDLGKFKAEIEKALAVPAHFAHGGINMIESEACARGQMYILDSQPFKCEFPVRQVSIDPVDPPTCKEYLSWSFIPFSHADLIRNMILCDSEARQRVKPKVWSRMHFALRFWWWKFKRWFRKQRGAIK